MAEVIALDIGGTKIHAAIVNESGALAHSRRIETRPDLGEKHFIDAVIQIISELKKLSSATAVGIGCAGPLDGHKGLLLDPTNFFVGDKSWGVIDLLTPLRKALPQLRFVLDNDAAAAVLAEMAWGGSGRTNIVAMTLGTGVGIGAIIAGQLVRSRDGLHPEASHIPLNSFDSSHPCGCGNWGCIEAYLSGPAVMAQLQRELHIKSIEPVQLNQFLEDKNPVALRTLHDYGEWLAHAIHAMAVLYGPEHVALSGGFSALAKWFLPTTQQRLPELLKRRRDVVDFLPTVSVSRLGDDLGVLGAGRLALI